MLLAKLQFTLLLRAYTINSKRFKSIYRSKLDLFISMKMKASSRLKSIASSSQSTSPSLKTLPVEIRLKIFEHLTEDTSIRVAGYRYGGKDAFWFKDRGYLPIIVTCKQFYEEMMDVYFKNVPVSIKSASPSDFSGDMSTFGSDSFRRRIRKVEILDHDEGRRARIGSAFENAKIEYKSRSGSGSRKGAYYFSG
ncbi:hypothetical protein OHC33_009713 [Knufia fluminis]|uniref:F-box domain-containing protein n=1 Tax=Knufia fluminis TaxID=191047 RepID=A0AAN8I1J3_9EURO|nr:hypothetical protein OHC33_009713 [Knufia fluminis]